MVGLASLWVMSDRSVLVRYPAGPIASVTLPSGFAIRGTTDLPRSMVAREGGLREFQILTVSTEAVGVDEGPLSPAHREMIEHPDPDFRDVVEINGFTWNLEVSSGPLSQMLAVAEADDTTIGVIGTGDWSLAAALEVLHGIERRR